jgi:Ca2+-binding EF-hand superfamily protein
MRLRYALFSLLVMVPAVGSDAAAQRVRSPFDFNETIARNLVPGARLARFLGEMRTAFLRHDHDRDSVISAIDRERSRQMLAALERSKLVTPFLRVDLDGDGVVTREEVLKYETHIARTSLRGEGPQIEARRQQQVSARLAALMVADRNGDGRIDWSEMIAHAKQAVEAGQHVNFDPAHFDPAYRVILGFDADGDGKTTLAEFMTAMEKQFDDVDTNSDGVISRGEFDAYWQRIGRPAPKVADIKPSEEDKRVALCAPPRVPKDVKFVLFNGSGGRGISTVAIGSQDRVTKTTRVTIEPGSDPLYLVLISPGPTVWQFDGAVDRVRRAVLLAISGEGGGASPAGATGLSKDVITVGRSGTCMDFWVHMQRLRDHPHIMRHYSLLLFGRQPDAVVEAKGVWNLHLPSGKTSEPTEAEQRSTFPIDNPTAIHLLHVRESLLSSSPGGVVPIDPAVVIAGQPVARYEVLPEQAGLLQLMLEGTLERNQKGEFLVGGAMRFPAGLAGGDAVIFRIRKGVPVPTGDPGHSKVWSDETGDFLCLNRACRTR